MADLSAEQKRTLIDTLTRLDAILTLACANFPRTNEVRIETCGDSPSGSMTAPYYLIKKLADLARAALQTETDQRATGGGK
jgi:hypothetical protein